MIPIRDSEPSGITPYVTIGLIVINTVIALIQFFGPNPLIEEGGLRPAWFLGYLEGETSVTVTVADQDLYGAPTTSQKTIPLTFGNAFLPLLLSMFLHGGMMHLFGNMLFLWIFGDNIEGRLGHVRYLIFYLLGGVLASLVHVVLESGSATPMVGASGAIAVILGSYWLCYPHSEVTIFFWIYIFIRTFQIRASWFLGFWFAKDVFTAYIGLETMVAVWAHIGGFVAGTCLVIPFTPRGHAQRPARFRFANRSGTTRD